jgi:glycosyltransferase involved in cell wall biosynthesis
MNKKTRINLLYIVGFSLKETSGRSTGTQNKYRHLKDKYTSVEMMDVSSTFSYKILNIVTNNQRALKIFSLIEMNIILFFVGIVKRHWNIIIIRDFPLITWKVFNFMNILTISEVHADLGEEIKLTKSFGFQLIGQVYLLLINSIIRSSDGVIYNHPALKHHYDKKLQLDSNTIYQYNGSDIDNFYPIDAKKCRKELHIPNDKIIFVFAGSVNIWHGVEHLLSTFSELQKINNNVLLYIVGDGIEKRSSKLRKKYNNKAIIFTGKVSREDSRIYINAAHYCMLPVNNIRISPGSPIKLYDYAACGKLIITQKNTVGYSDVVQENKIGIAVDFFNYDLSAIDINNFISRTINSIEENSEHVRNVAMSKISWSHRIELWGKYIDLLYKNKQNKKD